MPGRGKSGNPQTTYRALRSASAFAAAALAVSSSARAAIYYWSGDQSSGGSVNNPIDGTWSSATTANWYQDPAGATSYGVGVNPASAATTTVQFGGAAGSSAYTVAANSAITMNVIVLDDGSSVTDTLNFTLTGSAKIGMSTNGSVAAGIQQLGASSWDIANGGPATAPIRANNSWSITGNGSGNITLGTPLANNGSAVNFSINETGGSIITIPVSNTNIGGSGKAFTLTAGTVDFQNGLALGNAAMTVNLNGGTLQSSTGNALSTYSGGISIGSNFTFAGPVNWSLGSSAVTLGLSSNITADTAGSTGTTIAGAIGGAGSGLTLTSASTGSLTLTNAADTYSGPTNIDGGTLFNNGDITASTVTVGTTGALAGNGTLGASVINQGLIAPGATSGTIANLTFLSELAFIGSDADYNADVDAAGLSDELAVSGNLDLGTGSTLNVNVLDSTSGGDYTIATYTGALTGTFAMTNLPPGYSIDYGTGDDSAITLVVVPEPASLSLLALSAAALLCRRRVSGPASSLAR